VNNVQIGVNIDSSWPITKSSIDRVNVSLKIGFWLSEAYKTYQLLEENNKRVLISQRRGKR